MIPQIIPVITPKIDWPTLAKVAETVLGYNPVKPAENLGRQLADPAKLLAVLSAFQDRNQRDPLNDIRNAGSLLSHLEYAFIVAASRETIFKISTASRLNVTPSEAVDGNLAVIVSGDLSEWRAASIELCTDSQPMPVRVLFDKVVIYFEQQGLGEVWSDYRRVPMKDTTFKLVHKS